MEKHRHLTLLRLNRFKQELKSRLYRQRHPVELSHYATADRIRYAQALQATYSPISLGIRLGPLWSTHWFKVSAQVPVEWQGEEVHFLWDSSSEALIWRDGEPCQGLTGSSSGWQEAPIRTATLLTKQAQGGEGIHLMVEAAMNGLFGIPLDDPRKAEGIGWLRQAEIAVFDRKVWNLLWDFTIIADMAQELPENTPRGGQALYTANAIINQINWQDARTLSHASTLASEFLSHRNGSGQHQVSAIGHAHIDTAWLWPMAETKRKCARTLSSVLQLMERYPSYQFAFSQAQQFAWMKSEYPALYQRILEKVKEGRFHPVGATWVEPDTNLPGGESLVRQFLYGQRFFKEEFGEISRIFWEPDVFGYAAALPQIMRLAGVEYFLTQKLSWNEWNKPTRHTFFWEGLDGSRVLAHFPPVDTYNSLGDVHDVLFSVANFKDHERASESYLLFGYGDGGGGPTAEMVEQLNRMEDVDGLPRVQYRSPEKFFDRCQVDYHDPTVWVGELYFENHRGTFTSQANIKRDNRRTEELLHDLELLAAWSYLAKGNPYPREKIRSLWQALLTNQFHDILPGSSIHEVYEDAAEIYQNVMDQVHELKKESLASLLIPDKNEYTLLNTTPVVRREVIRLPEGEEGDQIGADGEPLAAVQIGGYHLEKLKQTRIVDVQPVLAREENDYFIMENEYVRVTVNRQGELISLLVNSNERECIPAGEKANDLRLYEDIPYEYDAWNVDVYYPEKPVSMPKVERISLIEHGPLRAAVQFYRPISSQSYLVQTISLTALSPLVTFDTRVSWYEEHKFLRVAFPLQIHARQATYEVQFGLVQRPTHTNTNFDLAQFEVPAQRWADLSEPDFGVALLNDSKYGYACQGNVLSLSLLRSPTSPDPLADRGEHRFRYGLLPHALSPQLSAVWSQAMSFNQPLTLVEGLPKETGPSLFRIKATNIVLDTIKLAEDEDTLILRMYEASGLRTTAQLNSRYDMQVVHLCDLLERDLEVLDHSENELTLTFRPFQIKTIKVKVNSR